MDNILHGDLTVIFSPHSANSNSWLKEAVRTLYPSDEDFFLTLSYTDFPSDC